ncbi:MAG: DUF533 domain-containing protein [Bdellovibrionales bacterium]|nr:DUF533 domain-containing protein [Bdellovibrionales bacterium]
MDKNKKEMTKSHFNMWRLVVSAVHADDRVDPAELEMVEHYLSELNFDEEHLNILKKELHQPANLDEILPAITDPGDRSQSAYFVRLLFWKDKILTAEEESFLKKVQGHFSQFLNIDELKTELSQFKEQDDFDSLPDTPVLNLWRKISSFFKK